MSSSTTSRRHVAEKSSPTQYGCNQPKLPLSKELSEPPAVAVPTVVLAIVALTWYGWTQIRYWSGDVTYASALLQWSVSAYICFTPTHDASHDAIASTKVGKAARRLINGLTGRLCALTLCAPFNAFRFLHLQHHKFTNVPGKDPDLWSSLPRSVASNDNSALRQLFAALIMPLKWTTQTYAYVAHYLAHRSERPVYEQCETIAMVLAQVVYPLVSLALYGAESRAFFCYALPGYLAIGCLAFFFDYLPHRPHGTTDIYQGTNITALSVVQGDATSATSSSSKSSYWATPLTALILYQNYHVVHHLYPWIPFYRYSKVWYAMEKQLIEAGVQIVPVFPVSPPLVKQ